ncbi:hypothetical protein HK097_011071 [Rhizophlyctis rosea]|uniref:EF-hand domain-containing protein n=1 Tax=Rhizophlyctis rosea TaxID=64517 RepID=A0AAD5S8H6_9FUNG|nr:hypothetical protein HK097_011071 [Rhizophlyctis rosea]
MSRSIATRTLRATPTPLIRPILSRQLPTLSTPKRFNTTQPPLPTATSSPRNPYLFLGASAAALTGALLVGYATAEIVDAKDDSSQNIIPEQAQSTGEKYPKSLMVNGVELPVITQVSGDAADVDKPRLVILGSGWAATSILKELEPNSYYTVVVSPQNYFLFTPLLPEAASGTVEARSLLESIRKICRRSRSHYCEGEAHDVHLEHKMVEIVGLDGKHFLLPYDKLVISVGAQNNTFGVPGVKENTHFLKTIQDARTLRYKLMNLFEAAALPTKTDEERRQLLSFVIAGGGPTGVEYAAGTYDLIHYFPDLLEKYVSVTIIQSADHILNTFSEAISVFAEKKMQNQNINVITNARVTAVEKEKIVYKKKGVAKGEKDTFEIPFGLCVWSTGVGMRDFTKRLNDKIEMQNNKRALEVDSRLRLKGAEGIYAVGDCATIENPKMIDIVIRRFEKLGAQRLNYEEFCAVIREILAEYPQSRVHLSKMRQLFDDYDVDRSAYLELEEIQKMLKDINNKLTSLPATAQVAAQQGAYLGKKLSSLSLQAPSAWAVTESTFKPFAYRHFGSFSYVGGDNAVVDMGDGWSGGGVGVYFLWRGAYLSKQVSFRTRALLAFDWVKGMVFGRDITRS